MWNTVNSLTGRKQWILLASLSCCPITDNVTVLQGVLSFRIGHIHAGMHSLLPKRQRIDPSENIALLVCNGQLTYRANKVY